MTNVNLRRESLLLIAVITAFIIILSGFNAHAAVSEVEPNDAPVQANTVSIGKTVYGSAYYFLDDEYDYYKFTAPISGTAKITAYADKMPTDGTDWSERPMGEDDGVSILVEDNKGNEVGWVFDSGARESGTSSTFPVVAGKTYYFKCHGRTINTPANIEYHFSLGYSIQRTAIKNVRGKKKAFNVKWDKIAKTSFYQVQYVKKSVFDDYNWTKAKIVRVSAKAGSKTIKKLPRKTKYYVRVRVARTIQGKTYYSSWSRRKLVKTK